MVTNNCMGVLYITYLHPAMPVPFLYSPSYFYASTRTINPLQVNTVYIESEFDKLNGEQLVALKVFSIDMEAN